MIRGNNENPEIKETLEGISPEKIPEIRELIQELRRVFNRYFLLDFKTTKIIILRKIKTILWKS